MDGHFRITNVPVGKSTDSSEKGNVMWARVKGKTENAMREFSFRKQYNFRPGFMKPTPGQKHVNIFTELLAVSGRFFFLSNPV